MTVILAQEIGPHGLNEVKKSLVYFHGKVSTSLVSEYARAHGLTHTNSEPHQKQVLLRFLSAFKVSYL